MANNCDAILIWPLRKKFSEMGVEEQVHPKNYRLFRLQILESGLHAYSIRFTITRSLSERLALI